jgi:hypothetical protein
MDEAEEADATVLPDSQPDADGAPPAARAAPDPQPSPRSVRAIAAALAADVEGAAPPLTERGVAALAARTAALRADVAAAEAVLAAAEARAAAAAAAAAARPAGPGGGTLPPGTARCLEEVDAAVAAAAGSLLLEEVEVVERDGGAGLVCGVGGGGKGEGRG